jgi:hypothetical protein
MAAPTPVSNSWSALLPAPSIDYNYDPEVSLARTDMDSGVYRQRRRYTTQINFVKASWLFDDVQLEYFTGWHKLNLLNGSLPFNIDLAFGGGLLPNVAKFVNGKYSSSNRGVLNWQVSAVLQVDEPNIIDSESALLVAAMVLSGVPVSDQDTFWQALEDCINNNNFAP